MTRILIDTSSAAPQSSFLFQDPCDIISASHPDEIEKALNALQSALDQGYALAGFFSYELGYFFEEKLQRLLPEGRKTPLLWFGVFKSYKKLFKPQVQEYLTLEQRSTPQASYRLDDFSLVTDRETYRKNFNLAKAYISSGDIYQLNLTIKLRFRFSGNIYRLYQDLKQRQNMAHGAVIETEEFQIVSASPELFLDIDNRSARCRPMKGTIGRGKTREDDQNNKHLLALDEKSRAENLMIVDLMRNDLARISEIGSVHVESLFDIETYPTLHQMTSTVCSTLKADILLKDWLKALFPPGSITGAPKVRAMELIRDLETEARGVYTGTIGMILPATAQSSAYTSFNVAIRTVTVWPDGSGEMGIGSGVVSDSLADQEYDECLLKMKFLTESVPDFSLIESFMHDTNTGYHLYEYHLKRLEHSAQYFHFPFERHNIEHALNTIDHDMSSPCHRVRLLLNAQGHISVTSTAVPCPSDMIMRFVISDMIMNTENLFLYHKTTHRAFYDDEHEKMTKAWPCDEVIFLNERGELTEGSRTNIFIEKDGSLLTPALSCGLLAGTLRASLIEQGRAKEAVLSLKDLEEAEKIYLGNSVRGLLKAEHVKREKSQDPNSHK